MKRDFLSFHTAAGALAALLALVGTPSLAQTVGYVTEGSNVVSFNTATGSILQTFAQANGGGEFGTVAVSADGATLYSPIEIGSNGVMENFLAVMSASTGRVEAAIPGLVLQPKKALLSPSGAYAYVMASGGENHGALVSVVNLATQQVVAYIQAVGGAPFDIALSPDGTKLYMANEQSSGGQGNPGAVSSCPRGPMICVFDTTTYALIGQVAGLYGFLAVSQDGNSLYTWATTPYYVAINTSTLATKGIALPSGFSPGAVAVAPSGNQAVLLTGSSTTTKSFILDTLANQITATFPAPESALLVGTSSAMAFTPDGSSIWTLGGCNNLDGCYTLYGQSFPSGTAIAQTTLPGFGPFWPSGITF